ncbi:MAG: serine hydrolase [Bacteroidota bacterium]
MKLIKKILKRILQVVILLFIVANLFVILSGRFYLYKGIYNTYCKGRTGPSIYDRDVFAFQTLKKSGEAYQWIEKKNQKSLSAEDEKFITSLKGSSFLVFKNDTLVFEKYWNGHEKNTVSNSFSATKTFVSLLVGIAVGEGKIKSLDEKVSTYIPEFKEGDKNKITIRQLLMMSSGLDWEESGKNPLSENAESYYGTDLYGLVTRQKAIEKPGVRFNYQSGNSQLLGFVIEKATGKDLTQYAQEKIWSQIGSESDAYWSLDKENGDEKSFCCLYGTSRDFARLGKLILQKGVWIKNGENKQIVPESYMEELFENPEMTTDEEIKNYRYGLHIWTYLGNKNPVYYCRGILGQYIITIPNENIIIVRTGEDRMKNIEKHRNKYKIGHPGDLFRYVSMGKHLAEK